MKLAIQQTDSLLKLKAIIRIKLNAQSATSGQPVGPLLGQFGVPLIPFCKEFNERTSNYHADVEVFVIMKLFVDNSYTFSIKPPSLSFLLIRASNIWKDSVKQLLDNKSNLLELASEPISVLTTFQLYEIVLYKNNILSNNIINKELFKKSLGTLRSISSIDCIDN